MSYLFVEGWMDGMDWSLQLKMNTTDSLIDNWPIAINTVVRPRKHFFQIILEKGHTQMECYSEHTAYEKALRTQDKIDVPSNYKTYAEEACRKHLTRFSTWGMTSSKPAMIYNVVFHSPPWKYSKVRDLVVTDILQLRYKVGSLENKHAYWESDFLLSQV